MTAHDVVVRWLGRQDYQTSWEAMRAFTDQRGANTADEIWLLEHPPIFTQGQRGKPEHLLNAGNIPVIKSDRGGQITYHGPGQLIAYTLIDVQRKKLNIRELVSTLENAVIDLLAEQNIIANAKCEAPGVYVDHKKICSIGLRIRRGASFHGLALNVNMDLSPFSQINPCGYAQLQMTQLADLGILLNTQEIGLKLTRLLAEKLNYTQTTLHTDKQHAD